MKKKESSVTEENFDMFMAQASEQDLLAEGTSEDKPQQSSEQIVTSESDKDSDYAGSETESVEVTTLRMLLERLLGGEEEFIACCQRAGLIRQAPPPKATSAAANATSQGAAQESPAKTKKVPPSSPSTLLEDTWLQGLPNLVQPVLVLYCWARGYSSQLCRHETDVDMATVLEVYSRCEKLCVEYFSNDISSIGGQGEEVNVDLFTSEKGENVLAGVEKKNDKNVFFRILEEGFTRDDLISALVDNVASDSRLHSLSPILYDRVTPLGRDYLDSTWRIAFLPLVSPGAVSAPEEVAEEEEVAVAPPRLRDVFTECLNNSARSLAEGLMRRRMESVKDPFLYLLSVISALHPLS